MCDNSSPYECAFNSSIYASVNVCANGTGEYEARGQFWSGGYPGGSVTSSDTSLYYCYTPNYTSTMDSEPPSFGSFILPCDQQSDCVSMAFNCTNASISPGDVDGDGDDDYCAQGSPGVWWDCYDNGTQCPPGGWCDNLTHDCRTSSPEDCLDGVDNDLDFMVDADDPECCADCVANPAWWWSDAGGSCTEVDMPFMAAWTSPPVQQLWCCGNNASTEFRAVCQRSGQIDWGGKCTAEDDICCDAALSCTANESFYYECYPLGEVAALSDLNIGGQPEAPDAIAYCGDLTGTANIWSDCDENATFCTGCASHPWAWQENCTGAACWTASGEGAAFGEYPPGVGNGTECCGDDPSESYNVCSANASIAWEGNCTSAACCDSESCVDPQNGQCYNRNQSYNVSESGMDSFARCEVGSAFWVDCDDSTDLCGNCSGAAGWVSNCSGATCWTQSGEIALGEYPGGVGSGPACCGDDNSEYFTTAGIGPDQCCSSPIACVDNTSTCMSGLENTGTACSDGIDNDCDGLIDWQDDSCRAFINGTVRDDTGTPLPNTTITISGTNVDGDTVMFTTVTDINGDYAQIVILNISYDVIAVIAGFETGFEWDAIPNGTEVLVIDFFLNPASGCEDDCTSPGSDICRPECQGVNGCMYFSLQAAQRCEDQQLGWTVPYNATHQIECCEGTPSTRGQLQILNIQGPEHVAQVSRIISHGGQIIRLIIDVFR